MMLSNTSFALGRFLAVFSNTLTDLSSNRSSESISILIFTFVQSLKSTGAFHNQNQILENKHWKAAEKQHQKGMDLISLLKIIGFIPSCCYCLVMARACKSIFSAYLLPQSREHLASGWHLTSFSCSKREESQGQPIQPGCSAKAAVPS